jgi:hypothetical protein
MKIVRIVSILAFLGMTDCTGSLGGLWTGSGSNTNSSSATPKMSQYDVNKYAVNKTVCNPLGGGGSSSNPSQGLQASLWYLQSDQPAYYNVGDMISNGHASSESLFFNSLFVPTRLFSAGFPLQSGGSIADDQGNELIEYFALRFETVLQLGPNDVEGDYQLGLLADDGANWSLASDNQSTDYTVMVNDDGTHPTQMGCGSVVHMTASTKLNMRIDYYQGPRYEIALVPIWRLVNSSQPPSESLCNQNGNTLFFDPNNNSATEAAYTKLLGEGWYPLTSANYSLQSQASYNPCTTGTTPVISNLAILNNTDNDGFFYLTWTTDIAATDQALITDVASGVQTVTTSDNILRTSHKVQLTGVLVNHSYTVQAVSVSADLGRTVSSSLPLTFN